MVLRAVLILKYHDSTERRPDFFLPFGIRKCYAKFGADRMIFDRSGNGQ